MPALKRKRLQDEDQSKPPLEEGSRPRRATRQVSIPLPPLPLPPKSGSQGRSLRANSGTLSSSQDGTSVKTRGRGRPRRDVGNAATQAAQEGGRVNLVAARGKRGRKPAEIETKHERKLRTRLQPESAAIALKRRTKRSAKASSTVPDYEAEASSADTSSEDKEERREEGEEEEEEETGKANDDESSTETVSRKTLFARRPKRSTAKAVATASIAWTTVNYPNPLITDVNAPQPQMPAEASGKESAFNHDLPSPITTQPKTTATEVRPPPAPPPVWLTDATSHLTSTSAATQGQQGQPGQKQPLISPKLLKSLKQGQSSGPIPMGTITAPAAMSRSRARQSAPAPAVGSSMKAAAPPPGSGQPDRNIDKVVLGKICFRAWYPSYYGKEVLGETSTNTHHGKGHPSGSHHGHGSGKESHHGAHRNNQPILDRLYVCPWCFKYSKEIVPWWGHVQICERQFQIPGEKVYVHPKGIRTVRVPVQPTPKARRRRGGGEPEVQIVEQIVKDEGEWSIWEVDGEKDVNLSLFAKLFLDNKSVFFDVTGFNYFLLVYTPPLPAAVPSGEASDAASLESTGQDGAGSPPRSRVIGFFSKEKMSWDNNNLACILVFPPWQRKGLGSLLMGISYEISRREEVLGGPEKPISDLGKKGYKRFWAGEIARWLLSLPTASSEQSSDVSGEGSEEKAIVIDIADCSRATYIAQDDCLLVLREMGVAEDAGMGLPRSHYQNMLLSDEHSAGVGNRTGSRSLSPAPETTASDGKAAPATGSATTVALSASAVTGPLALPGAVDGGDGTAAAAPALSEKQDLPKEVQRVRISKSAVRLWVAKNRVSLEKACDPAGFIKTYTKRDMQQSIDE